MLFYFTFELNHNCIEIKRTKVDYHRLRQIQIEFFNNNNNNNINNDCFKNDFINLTSYLIRICLRNTYAIIKNGHSYFEIKIDQRLVLIFSIIINIIIIIIIIIIVAIYIFFSI